MAGAPYGPSVQFVPQAGRALSGALASAGIRLRYGITSGTRGEMLLLVGYRSPEAE
jgi:hypothetical protein